MQRLADTAAWNELIDQLDCGIALYDAEDRLVVCNRDFRRLYEPMTDELVAGRRFEDMLRSAVRRGLIPEAIGQEEAWVEQRLQSHRQPDATLLRRLANGRFRRFTETLLPDGSLLAFSVDVSEVVEKAEQLDAALRAAKTAGERLDDAVEALPVGFELWDVHERLVLCNGELRRMYPDIAQLLVPGARWEDLVRVNHARGALAVAADELEPYIRRRRAERRAGSIVSEHSTRDGRWIRTVEHAARDGALVCVRVDVTELVLRERQLKQLNAELKEARSMLEHLSETDALTAIANRRQFDRRLTEEWARIARHPSPLALLLVDVDHFKLYNDHYGHQAGDDCLRRMAAVLASCARRATDLVARYGGEEFAILMPHTTREAAAALAARCIEAVAAAHIEHLASPVADRVTLSIGGAVVDAVCGTEPQAMLRAADQALYRAKAAGRHRVEFDRPG